MLNLPSETHGFDNKLHKDLDSIKRDGETWFIRILNRIFSTVGRSIAKRPFLYAGISVILTAFASIKIPLTQMTNDVSDFTPYRARARSELESYREFFSNKGDPVVVFILVRAKLSGNMLGFRELGEAVRLLNIVSEKFLVFNSATNRNESFSTFCDNFCTLNEPIRHFYNGLLIEKSFGNTSTDHIDLGYPITTVLGRQLHMDPNLYGVKVAISSTNNFSDRSASHSMDPKVVSVNELRTENGHSIFDSPSTVQLPNNVREIKVVALQFRAERPSGIARQEIQKWEMEIANYVHNEFNDHNDLITGLVLAETYLTKEVVRAGLTLLPFLVIGFCIMVIFSACTMSISALYTGQMNVYRVLMAVVACCCPFMACGTALGAMFWLGFRFGSLLCVTPFLTLALGVDDAYLMVNAWQRMRKRAIEGGFGSLHSDTKESKNKQNDGERQTDALKIQTMMAAVMIDSGASITITTLTNVLAFVIGALTPTPEIRLFSIGNALAITVTYIYQWTVFGAIMAIFGRWELATEANQRRRDRGSSEDFESEKSPTTLSNSSSLSSTPTLTYSRNIQKRIQKHSETAVYWYCSLLTTKTMAFLVILCISIYLYFSALALINMRAELKPEQLFTPTSNVVELIKVRNEYITPFYAVCIVFVNNPGNITDLAQLRRLHSLVSDFESLPSSVGKFSTKFWLRDYEQFIQENTGGDSAKEAVDDLAAFEGMPIIERGRNELKQFLEWPEFSFWKGFLRLEQSEENDGEPTLSKFFFTTASYGAELKDWSNRAKLLQQWRRVADSYPDLEVTIYEDEAKFLDLIPTMVPQTIQSSICTLVCMFIVCLLFMGHPMTTLISDIAILSTCIGVFGMLGIMGLDLDPIVMSAAIMSIGFSVDIPAHISYHYHKTGLGRGTKRSVCDRLQECLTTIGFPVLEAGLSTIICVSSLLLVDLHMAQVFARTLILVVVIGLIHGLLIIPILFYIVSLLTIPVKALSSHLLFLRRDKFSAGQTIVNTNLAAPIVLTVNQFEKT